MDWSYRNSMANNCSSVKFHILVLGTFSHFLLTTNSSSNFFIYCMMSTEFRVCDLFKGSINQFWICKIKVYNSKDYIFDSPYVLNLLYEARIRIFCPIKKILTENKKKLVLGIQNWLDFVNWMFIIKLCLFLSSEYVS